MLDLTHLRDWTWETEYLSDIFALIPEVQAVALHWRSERLFRRRLARFRSKFLREKLRFPADVTDETVVVRRSGGVFEPEGAPRAGRAPTGEV